MSEPWIIPAAEAETDARPVLAELIGADYSASALTPQRSDLAPDVVRAALPRFAPWDSRDGTDLAGAWCVADHGDAGGVGAKHWDDAVGRIGDLADVAFGTGSFVVALGGDHSVSWPLIAAAARATRSRHGRRARVGVIQLDVHHDVREIGSDGPSNGTPFRGLLERGVLEPDELVQIGIHPFANRRPLTEYCDKRGIRRITLDDIARDGADETAAIALAALVEVDTIYLSIDIDVLDRAFAPGTAAALPGGLDPRTMTRIVELVCADPRAMALDVVEFDPQRDVASVTAYAVAHAVMAGLAAVARRQAP